MLNELKINYFLVLADMLNFTAAADELHITQQALSKQINQLEQELECTLFKRTPRGVILTDAGATMQRSFLSIKATLEDARVEIQNDMRNTNRVLNIGVGSGLRPGPFFTPLAQHFVERSDATIWYGQPDTFADLVSWLSQDKFDFVLCTDDYGGYEGELQAIRLCRTPLYFFVNRTLPIASPNAKLRDFRSQPFYLTNNEQRENRILNICMNQKFYPEHTFTTANPYSTYLMSEMGDAVTFGSGFSMLHLDPAVRSYRIPNEEVNLILLYHPEHISTQAKAFLEYLFQNNDPDQLYYPPRN